ncbi:hypothetical protein DFJ63DRAFT_310410 [Scheffersomyces coipomensis]|uniref:uncharacterized protein n=1 Tax=Scheffersomyces coipomensis TaxID=1788519 RepID=UPI00315C6312
MIPNQYFSNPTTTPSTPSTVTPNSSVPSTINSNYTPRQAQFISFPTYNSGSGDSIPQPSPHQHHHHNQKLSQSHQTFLPDRGVPSFNLGFHLPPIKSIPVTSNQSSTSNIGSTSNASNSQINQFISFSPVYNSGSNNYKRSRGNSVVATSSSSSLAAHNQSPHSSSSSSTLSSSISSIFLNQNQSGFVNKVTSSTPLYRNLSAGEVAPFYYKFPNYPSVEEQVPYNYNIDNNYQKHQSKELNSALPPQSTFIHHQKSKSLPSTKVFHMKPNNNKSEVSKPSNNSYHMVNRFSSGSTSSTSTSKSGIINTNYNSPPSKQFKYKAVSNIGNNANSQLRMSKHKDHHHSQSESSSTRHRSTNATTSTIISKSSIHYPIHRLPVEESRNIPVQKSVELRLQIYPLIEVKKYSTSAIDPIRNYLTVYEYHINDHWIIWDYETGFVHLTGIWKAALVASNNYMNANYGSTSSNLKADIVKLLESCPKEYHQFIKRIRGGFLKIQGTWLPYKLCRILARRFCYFIRFDLIPIFGNDFPEYCLTPNDRGFGELKLNELPQIDSSEFDLPVLSSIPNNSNLVIVGGTGEMGEPQKRIVPPSDLSNDPKRKKISLAPVNGYPKKEKESRKKSKSEAHIKQEVKHRHDNVKEGPLQGTFIPLPQPPNFKSAPILSASSSTSNMLLDSPIVFNSKKTDEQPIVVSTNLLLKQVSPYENQHDLSYTEVMDLVNASKCLQSLSKSNSATQVSPINDSHNKDSFNNVEIETEGANYTTASPAYNKSGISTILLAAGLSSETEALVRDGLEMNDLKSSIDSSPTQHHRRASMKINDLLS